MLSCLILLMCVILKIIIADLTETSDSIVRVEFVVLFIFIGGIFINVYVFNFMF